MFQVRDAKRRGYALTVHVNNSRQKSFNLLSKVKLLICFAKPDGKTPQETLHELNKSLVWAVGLIFLMVKRENHRGETLFFKWGLRGSEVDTWCRNVESFPSSALLPCPKAPGYHGTDGTVRVCVCGCECMCVSLDIFVMADDDEPHSGWHH